MNVFIELIPALKRLELKHVGCWEELALEFLPGMNIVTEEGSACGTSTIFEAIRQSLMPSYQRAFPLSPTIGFAWGRIFVEFMSLSQEVVIRVADDAAPRRDRQDSAGQSMLRQLRYCLQAATPSMALLVADDVTAVLDPFLFREARRLLTSSRCQVLCQIAHRFNPGDFPKARVYGCYLEGPDKPRMRLIQSGV